MIHVLYFIPCSCVYMPIYCSITLTVEDRVRSFTVYWQKNILEVILTSCHSETYGNSCSRMMATPVHGFCQDAMMNRIIYFVTLEAKNRSVFTQLHINRLCKIWSDWYLTVNAVYIRESEQNKPCLYIGTSYMQNFTCLLMQQCNMSLYNLYLARKICLSCRHCHFLMGAINLCLSKTSCHWTRLTQSGFSGYIFTK